jgi:hypothetical protein
MFFAKTWLEACDEKISTIFHASDRKCAQREENLEARNALKIHSPAGCQTINRTEPQKRRKKKRKEPERAAVRPGEAKVFKLINSRGVRFGVQPKAS